MIELNKKYLSDIKPRYIENGYSVPKWILFSEAMLDLGCKVSLHESQSTVSKYIYVSKSKKHFKIRFSNHKPAIAMESQNDCDYYVGISNHGVITTENLIKELTEKFRSEEISLYESKHRSNKEIANEVMKKKKTAYYKHITAMPDINKILMGESL